MEKLMKTFICRKVVKLKTSLHSFKQAPRCWNKKFNNFLINQGFQQSVADKCVYTGTIRWINFLLAKDLISNSSSENLALTMLIQIEYQLISKQISQVIQIPTSMRVKFPVDK